MADIGLNPPAAGNIKSRTGRATTSGITFGMLLVSDTSDGAHEAMTQSTSAGQNGLTGVCTSQGDPNNSDAFAIGDEFSCRSIGDAEVLVLGSTSYDENDYLIASTTPGVAKKLESETGVITLLGRCMSKLTTGTNPQRVSCELAIQKIKL